MSRVAEGLKDADVLGWSSNQAIDDPAARRAVFDFVEAGKGVLLMHPGLWYNWKDWPEYNRCWWAEARAATTNLASSR